jgi:hypothetical protein
MEDEILERALAPGTGCLPVEQLGSYADGALTSAERDAIATHLRGCINCRAELALLEGLTSPAVVEADGRRRASKAGWRSTAVGLMAAAAVVLLFVFAGDWLPGTSRAPSVPNSGEAAADVARSMSVSIRGPIGDLGQAPRRLEWTTIAGADRYIVRVMEVDRHEIWSATTPAGSIDLPAEIQSAIVPPKTLLWEVTAYAASGAEIAASGVQSFRVLSRAQLP